MKKYSKLKNYLLLHLLLLLFSFCSVFSKLASSYNFLTPHFFVFYGISLVILGIYALSWQQILKKFSLTTAFLNKSVTIIWGIIWGIIFFNETIKPTMIIGALIVLIGVSLVVMSDE